MSLVHLHSHASIWSHSPHSCSAQGEVRQKTMSRWWIWLMNIYLNPSSVSLHGNQSPIPSRGQGNGAPRSQILWPLLSHLMVCRSREPEDLKHLHAALSSHFSSTQGGKTTSWSCSLEGVKGRKYPSNKTSLLLHHFFLFLHFWAASLCGWQGRGWVQSITSPPLWACFDLAEATKGSS